MPKKTAPRRKFQPIVAAVVQPVAKRLSRIEDLLIEMRHEQDVQLKRIAVVQDQLDALTDRVTANRKNIRRISGLSST